MRRALTLVELLVVVAVIAALMALSFGAWAMLRAKADRDTTQMLVDAAMLSCPPPERAAIMITCRDGVGRTCWMLGQTPGDQAFDGDPQRCPPAHPLVARAPADYRGFVAATGFPAKAGVDAMNRPLDRYGRPLRVRFDPKAYGPGGFGVWSAGKDGVDGTADDLVSWRRADP